ncbi:hypothetical protein NDU88_002524 [Pleurodeles waltl]|uniref:Uncharacterized protein n=1 Tax=Pleurodeles waltl TaxID=8319 RepID=A0AAV7VDY6_PLEWA|nr:hypothetical protein NDU88_002524 [Pleurodeles waltl]
MLHLPVSVTTECWRWCRPCSGCLRIERVLCGCWSNPTASWSQSQKGLRVRKPLVVRDEAAIRAPNSRDSKGHLALVDLSHNQAACLLALLVKLIPKFAEDIFSLGGV